MLRAFSSLHQRNFRLFWFGQTFSSIGTWMQTVGQAWLVLQLTHSALQLGLIGALQAVPVLLFSLIGGVLVDRWPKRRVLFTTQGVAMLQASLLWVLSATGSVQLWHIYLLAALLGLTTCVDMPARHAFLVELVGRSEITNALALNSSIFNVARIAGPSLGGLIIAASGVTTLFGLNALSFIAVLLALALIKPDELHFQERQGKTGTARQTTWQSVSDGFRYALTTPAILWLLVIVGLVLFFGSNFNVVLPLFATTVLHGGGREFGFLYAGFGAGSILAALWLAWSNLRGTIRRVLIAMLLFCVLEAGFAVSQLSLLSFVLIASVGAAEETIATLAITMFQTLSPDHLRGRITSIYFLFFSGSVPFGYIMTGWLSTQYGPTRGVLILSLLSLTAVGVGWLWWQTAGTSLKESALSSDI